MHGRDAQRKGVEGAQGLHASLGEPPSQHLHVCTNLELCQHRGVEVFMEV